MLWGSARRNCRPRSGRTTLRYGAACSATEPSSAFDAYLKQCSDDTTDAAGGASLPDYVGDLMSCNADLSTCNADLTSCNASLTTSNGDLASCTGDLATTSADLTTCNGDLVTCVALPPARLLKTGQTTSHGAGTDGDLQLGVTQGYVDNGDGTITNTKTGLMWEKKSDDDSIHDKDNSYSWTSYYSGTSANGTVFTTFLPGLNAAGGFTGHTDWRLPNLNELASIRDLQNENPPVAAAFNSNCGANSSGNAGCAVTTCSCTQANVYWSSSSYAHYDQYAWNVNFTDGNDNADFKY